MSKIPPQRIGALFHVFKLFDSNHGDVQFYDLQFTISVGEDTEESVLNQMSVHFPSVFPLFFKKFMRRQHLNYHPILGFKKIILIERNNTAFFKAEVLHRFQ